MGNRPPPYAIAGQNMEGVYLPPKVIPSVHIEIDKAASAGAVEAQMHAVNKVLNPEYYVPPPSEIPDKDEYGTPLGLLNLPDIFDETERNRMMGRTVVSPMSMLMMRLKWGGFSHQADDRMFGQQVPFEHLSVHLGKDKASVFIVSNGETVTLSDGADAYPSDTLITQIKMLAERHKT